MAERNASQSEKKNETFHFTIRMISETKIAVTIFIRGSISHPASRKDRWLLPNPNARMSMTRMGNAILMASVDCGASMSAMATKKSPTRWRNKRDASRCIRRLGISRRRRWPNCPPSLENGCFYAPTILDDLPDDDVTVQEQIFGSVLAVQVVDSAEEAIAAANCTRLGFCAGIYTKGCDQGYAICPGRSSGLNFHQSVLRRLRNV